MSDQILAPAPRTDAVSVPGRGPVPVTLLTGFLGAGKTTLLNRILSGDHGLRVGVLVNDFGAINIDAALVESVEENTISLTNGCVCCEIRDDLVTSLEDILTRTDAIDYVILEASGVADPAGIVMTFLDARYRNLLRLDSIICVVDAEGIFADEHDEQLSALKLRQVAFADLVLLNKTDLVSPDHVAVAREWIDLHLQRIRIVEASHGEAPLEVLVGAGRFDPGQLPLEDIKGASEAGHGREAIADTLDRWSYRTSEPFDLDALQRMVKRELPGSVYRCKGVLFVSGSEEAHALQVVGRRTDLAPLGWDRREGRCSEVIAIGRDLDRAQLDELFASCLAGQ